VVRFHRSRFFMANFRNLKGGAVSSHTRLKGAIIYGRYYRVEFVGDELHDLWKITLGNKEVRFNSRRHAQMCLESLKAGDPPTGFHKPGEPPTTY
jgi:hypothetical protein